MHIPFDTIVGFLDADDRRAVDETLRSRGEPPASGLAALACTSKYANFRIGEKLSLQSLDRALKRGRKLGVLFEKVIGLSAEPNGGDLTQCGAEYPSSERSRGMKKLIERATLSIRSKDEAMLDSSYQANDVKVGAAATLLSRNNSVPGSEVSETRLPSNQWQPVIECVQRNLVPLAYEPFDMLKDFQQHI